MSYTGGNLTLYELLNALLENGSESKAAQKLTRLLEQQDRVVLLGLMANGRNLLHCCCMFSKVVAVKALLKLECSKKMLNQRDDEGNTPLVLSCRIKCSKISEILLDYGADVDILCSSGLSIVHHCSITGDIDFLRYMAQKRDLRKYARLISEGGVEPIHLACKHGNTSVVKLLKEYGADVNQPHGLGETPLYLAVQSTNKETIEYLRQEGAEFDLGPEPCLALISGLVSRQSIPCVVFMLRQDLRYVSALTKIAFDLPFESATDAFYRGVIGELMEDYYDTSVELRREMEQRTRDELRRIVGGEPFERYPDDLRMKTKRFITWLAYCYNAIEFKARRAGVPDYVKQNKAAFPGFLHLWKNPRRGGSKKHIRTGSLGSSQPKNRVLSSATSSSKPTYLPHRHAMDDAVWSKLKVKVGLEEVGERAKCFLLDCYYLWTKGTAEEDIFCNTIVLYKEEIKHVLDTDSDSLETILCFLGALAKIPELDEFIEETLYQCDLSLRRKMFYDTMQALSGDISEASSILNRVDLVVDRMKLFETSCERVKGMSRQDLFNLSVQFLGEEGQGVGIKREWINQLTDYLLDFKNGMFTSQNGGLNFQPSTISEEVHGSDVHGWFHLAGKVIAFSLLHGNTINVHFTKAFYKHILGFPLSFMDQEQEQLIMSQKLLEIDVTELDLVFALDTRDILTGEVRTIELIPGGADTPVTEGNKMRYVTLLSTYNMTKSIKPQIDSFVMGFHSVTPKSYIRFFKAEELELLLCGLPEISVTGWKQNTEYEESSTTTWFWRIVDKMSWEKKQKLLTFWTAYPRVPYGGFESFGKNLSIEVGEWGDGYLPHAHTCFKILKLSSYSSKRILEKNLTISIEYAHIGHGLA